MLRWSPLAKLPRWPTTVRQPVGNPLQEDRLPDPSGVELDYPARGRSPADDRRHARLMLLACAAVSLAVGASGMVLQTRLLGTFFCACVATWAFVVFCRCDPGFGRASLAAALAGGPVLFIALLSFREPLPFLLVCLLAAVRVSDLFATHYFHLKTAAPLSRPRAVRLRALWARRRRGVASAAKGLELYALSTLGVAASLAFVYAREAANREALLASDDRTLDHLIWWYLDLHGGPLALGLVPLLAWPWLLERGAAFLFARRPVGLRAMVRAFREAVVDWFAYNRQGAAAAGVFRSPSGTCRARRRMTFATVAAFSCMMVQFSNSERMVWENIFGGGGRRPAPVPSRPPADFEDGPDFAPGGPLGPPPLFRSPAGPTGGVFRPVSYRPDDDDPALQPWQRSLLRRMRPAEQAEYLERLRASASADAEPREESPAPKPSVLEADWERFLSWLFVSVPVLVYLAGVPAYFGLIPPLYFLACCFATTARAAGFWGQEFGARSGERMLNVETWDDLVDRVRASGDRIEKDSLLLGVNAHDDSPVVVPRAVFREHAHMLGDSGSGKTSLGIASLMTQFIRFGDCSVVVVDLKGDDLALMEGARVEAERAGLRFRWFSNELDRSTYVFNPLAQSHLAKLTPYQRTDVFAAALGLQYGVDYGRGYYSDANSEMLFRALKSRPGGVRSFAELAAVLRERAPFRDVPADLRAAGSHLGAVVNRLADARALNATPGDGCPDRAAAAAIDMPDVFRTPQVVYFHLASAVGMASTAEIARLALYSLLTAAKTAQGPRTQVYLFIDEFQRIVSDNLELVLQQARSLDVGVILANQTLGDLKAVDADLIPTVRANTRFRQIFAASDLVEQEEIVKTSGETTVYSRAWSQYLGNALGASARLSLTETLSPRLRVNDVLLATDHPQQSIVQIRRGDGYAQYGGFPFVMTSSFHIGRDEYERRKRAPWPERDGETIRPTLEPEGPPGPAATGPGPEPRSVLVAPPEVVGPGAPEAAPPADEHQPPPPTPPAADPFAALARSQEERRKNRTTRKKKGESP